MILGLIVALPSRRLVGDYLAIVTLFFGQLFVTVTNNGNRISFLGFTRGYDITGGPNGIADIDPFHFFGRSLESLTSYFYVALGFFLVMLVAVYLLNESRTGRAWRSLREDSLAAEMMGMPVNRLKLVAFAFGAGVAGPDRHALRLAEHGRLRRRLRHDAADHRLRDADPRRRRQPRRRDPRRARRQRLARGCCGRRTTRRGSSPSWSLATLIAKLRPWKWLAIVVGGTIAFGFAVHALLVGVLAQRDRGPGLRRRQDRRGALALGAAADGRARRRQLGVRRARRARARC